MKKIEVQSTTFIIIQIIQILMLLNAIQFNFNN